MSSRIVFSLVTKSLLVFGICLALAVAWWRSASRSDPYPPFAQSTIEPSSERLVSATRQTTQSAFETAWRAELAACTKTGAVFWLVSKLESGDDAPTGARFVLGPDVRLYSAPSWRIYWLEELGLRDSKAAAAQAKKILTTPSTPDEWAIALRWLALGCPDERVLLQAKTRTLLTYEPWRTNPAEAWLEAFDVAVYLGGVELVPELAALTTAQESHAANQAAFLALDRLVQRNPQEVLSALLAEPLIGRESMRGNLFARADANDPNQRRVLENYLLTAGRSRIELEAFADVFPNANYHVSPNLLTICTVPAGVALRNRDQASLQAVRIWRKDNRFASIDSHLARIEQRLQEFLAQSSQ